MKVESFRLIGGDIDGLRIPSVETLPEGLTQNLLVRHQGRLKYFDKSKGWSEAIRNSLFPFSSHTFTSASVRGRIGPTLAQCIAAYNGEWVNNEAFFTVRNGYQVWTVPETGTYRIVAVGACGASDNTLDGGGLGASAAGDFQLTAGDRITIVVGQTTGTISSVGGDLQAKPGGGGSFVFASNNFFNLETCLIAAGGGGGIRTQSYSHPVAHASLTTSGKNVNAISGNNGKGGVGGLGGYGGTADGGQGGAGILGDGGVQIKSSNASWILPRSISNGATGGINQYGTSGGFGGGGGWWGGGGGGGGYSGGGGGNWHTSVDAGGGGSYVRSSINRSIKHRTDRGNGYVTITKL